MNTSVDDILNTFNENDEKDDMGYISDRPQLRIFDFSLTTEKRMEDLLYLFETQYDDIIELLQKICIVYSMSPISLMRKFLHEICHYSTIPIDFRVQCALTLVHVDVSYEMGIECLNHLIDDILRSNIPTPVQFEYITLVVRSNMFPERRETLLEMTTRGVYPDTYRYRVLLSLQQSVGKKYMIEGLKRFIDHELNDIRYRLLAVQYLLVLGEDKEDMETFLMGVMEDTFRPHRERADAMDIVLRHGSDTSQQRVQKVLKELGGSGTIYENKENVHHQTIEKSVMDTIEYITTLSIEKRSSVRLSFEDIQKIIYNNTKQWCPENYEQVETALTRIELDTSIFKRVNHTLKSVLVLIYNFIYDTHDREEIEKRIIEELVDMAWTCTSGYLSRLVNVLSGFGNFSLSISWEEQIAANLKGRLNARIRNEDNMDDILEQMTNKQLSDRKAFMEFFIKHISTIREEMYLEFKEFMTDTDWDLWFKKAVMDYEQ